MRSSVRQLKRRDQLALTLYYERDLTYREIGLVLRISESRVCQVVRGLHARLRKQLDREPAPLAPVA